MLHWILFPAITMSLGWGLRGYIGGGPLGAMIPGAMVSLALCLLLGRRNVGLAAAFGAVGVGFGGQMTYGQTIGLTLQPETAAWGLLGLTLKGAIWGLLGGAVVAVGLLGIRKRTAALASAALIAACFVGWKLVNEPRLIYFSDPVNKPRAEIWAGLLLAALAYLVVVRSRVAWSFAGIAGLGGGLGFGIGGWINAYGRTHGMQGPIDWWKAMEFTFGFLFGAALGYAAWRWRDLLVSDEDPGVYSYWTSVLFVLIPAAIWLEEYSGFRFAYMAGGAMLLWAVALSPRIGEHVAVTMTVGAFLLDLAQSRGMAGGWSIAGVAAAAMIAAAVSACQGAAARLLLLLMWAAVVDSYVKAWAPPAQFAWGHANVEVAFTMLAVAVHGYARRLGVAKPPY